MASTINASTSGAGGVVTTADASGVLQLQTGGTTAVTVDASQNVGIGTASPNKQLQIQYGSTNSGQLQITNNSTGTTATDGVLFGYDTSNDVIINNQEVTAIKLYTSSAERMRIDASGNLLFNSGYGSVATAYGCRAWVNFNGTGTVSINASGNVTSITDNGTGDYTVNFTTAMVDANYAIVATDLSMDATFLNSVEVKQGTTPSTTSVNLIVSSVKDGGGTFIGRDAVKVYCSIFR